MDFERLFVLDLENSLYTVFFVYHSGRSDGSPQPSSMAGQAIQQADHQAGIQTKSSEHKSLGTKKTKPATKKAKSAAKKMKSNNKKGESNAKKTKPVTKKTKSAKKASAHKAKSDTQKATKKKAPSKTKNAKQANRRTKSKTKRTKPAKNKNKSKTKKAKSDTKKSKSKTKKAKSKTKKAKSKTKKTPSKTKKTKPPRKKTKSSRQSAGCLPSNCLDLAVSYMSLVRTKVANFQKQISRITQLRTSGSSKYGKQNLFENTKNLLITAGGGNISNLTCGSNQTNAGNNQSIDTWQWVASSGQ
jgi:hypothetical protein